MENKLFKKHNLAGLHEAGLHDHFNRGFFRPIFFHFESLLITFDLLEKSLGRKPAPIKVIM